MLGIALALASSLSWGISDFLGGTQTRRFSALSVLLVAQPVGLVVALAVALTIGGTPLSGEDFALAVLAGIPVVAALGAFYRAMALGSISVVTTIGAVGAAIVLPVVVVVAHDPDPEWRAASRHSIGLAALSALGFGLFLLIIDDVAGTDPIWTVLAALIAIGVTDVLANSLYATVTNHGILPLIAVAASMYAVVTVVLARIVLGERLAACSGSGSFARWAAQR